MSIFGTALTQLTTVDLQGLLQEAAVENVRLEFKLLFPNKEDTLKKLSSFANTFGGFMVIGAKANSATERIEDLPGINVEPGYKQKVVQWCFDAASPPITVQVLDPIPAPAGNAKVCYAVYVPASERLHIS
jgi:predicted HTH transcriptional regulator